jgi:hypothetical protein
LFHVKIHNFPLHNIILFDLFCQLFFIDFFIPCTFPINLAPIAHNVPAVYDVLAARIRALRSKDQGRQNVAEFWRGNEQSE